MSIVGSFESATWRSSGGSPKGSSDPASPPDSGASCLRADTVRNICDRRCATSGGIHPAQANSHKRRITISFDTFLLGHESEIRLGFFLGAFVLLAVWELFAPRRTLETSKVIRWTNNVALAIVNILMVRVLFPL